MRVRLLEERDFEAFGTLFDDAYSEYLEFLRNESREQFLEAAEEREEVTREGFDFYLHTGASFVAEEGGKVVGYVASQIMPSLHGVSKTLWVEYIVVQRKFRRQKIGLALIAKLLEYARSTGMERIFTTINPDNPASIQLATKVGFDVRDWKIATCDVKKSSKRK
jgi:RimJ/RimL family protein N-acetyltransferase